jgi:hypothetical protein
VARSSVQIDLEEQMHSVRHCIFCMYPTGSKVRILDQRPNTLFRPSWRVSYLTHRNEQLTSRRYRQVVDWTIDYYGVNRIDVMDQIDQFEKNIKHGGKRYRLVNLIPAVRFNWQYPQVYVDPSVGGSLTPGAYRVRVSAIDLYGTESGASVQQVVTLDAEHNSIKVRIPRVPYSQPLFKQFVVYVNEHEESRANLPQRWTTTYPQTEITNLLATGAAPKEPSDTIRVAWQYLRVTGFAASSREDEINNGVFTGNISLQTAVEQESDRVQVPVMERIEVATQLNYIDNFTITIGVP